MHKKPYQPQDEINADITNFSVQLAPRAALDQRQIQSTLRHDVLPHQSLRNDEIITTQQNTRQSDGSQPRASKKRSSAELDSQQSQQSQYQPSQINFVPLHSTTAATAQPPLPNFSHQNILSSSKCELSSQQFNNRHLIPIPKSNQLTHHNHHQHQHPTASTTSTTSTSPASLLRHPLTYSNNQFQQLGNNFRDLVGNFDAQIIENSSTQNHNLRSSSNLTSSFPQSTASPTMLGSFHISDFQFDQQQQQQHQPHHQQHQSHQLQHSISSTQSSQSSLSSLHALNHGSMTSEQLNTALLQDPISHPAVNCSTQQHQPHSQPLPAASRSHEFLVIRPGTIETDEVIVHAYQNGLCASCHPHPFLSFLSAPAHATQAIDPSQILLTARHLRTIEQDHYCKDQFKFYDGEHALRKANTAFLKETVNCFNIPLETYELATVYLDRVLSTSMGQKFAKSYTDYLPLTCLIIASKFNDPPPTRLTCSKFDLYFNSSLNLNMFKTCERAVLSFLDFRLHIPITSHFLSLIQHCGIIFTNDLIDGTLTPTVTNVVHTQSYVAFFLELYNSYKLRYYRPSLAAAAIIACARRAIGCTPVWNEKLFTTTHYNAREIFECYTSIYSIYQLWYPESNPSPSTVEEFENYTP